MSTVEPNQVDIPTATRSNAHVSLEGVSKHAQRTSEWLASVERGEVMVTEQQLLELGAALDKALEGTETEVPDLDGDLAELQQQPFGRTATGLRTKLRLQGWVGDPAGIAADITVGAETVSPIDRILVLGPAGLAVALTALVAQGLAWTLEAQVPADTESDFASWVLFVKDVVLSSTALFGLAAVLGIGASDRMLESRAARRRRGESKVNLSFLAEMAEHDGIDWSAEKGWRVEGLLPHTIPKRRPDVRKSAIRAAFSERIVSAATFGALIATLALVVALIGEASAHVWAQALILALILGLRRLSVLESRRAASLCAGGAIRALGWRPKADGYLPAQLLADLP